MKIVVVAVIVDDKARAWFVLERWVRVREVLYCAKKFGLIHSSVSTIQLRICKCIFQGPGQNALVIYIDGAFDFFDVGHVEILKKARQLGDFLLVGIHTDQTIRGPNHPIMHLHERSFNVLACWYVDEVIIGAPWEVTKDMITTFNISLVLRGTVVEENLFFGSGIDPQAVPKSMGIFQMLDSPENITTTSVAQRIIANHGIYKMDEFGDLANFNSSLLDILLLNFSFKNLSQLAAIN